MKPLLLVLVATGCWTSKTPAAHTEAPPPPPPPKVTELVQPVKVEKVEPVADEDEDGVEVGGVVGGVIGVPPPPPPPAPPQNVSPQALEGSRIAGDKNILPDDPTKVEITIAMNKGGPSTLIASLKMCVDAQGSITTVNLLKSSGYPKYDAKLANTIRTTWRYRPFFVNGNAVAVCTAVTFVYAQK